MRIHHLNCATMDGGRIVAHVLVVEQADGLLLVDAGFGLADVRERWARLGPYARYFVRPRLDEAETAVRQLAALGFRPSDVKRIACTHLDLDHAGGLGDFPHAEVHVLQAELDAATTRSSLKARIRYRPAHFAHGPKWAAHQQGGDRWLGFESVRPFAGDAIALVPLVGHTRGHTAVAIDSGDGWLLHCGDAYFHKGELDEPRACPARLRLVQRLNDTDHAARVANQDRLRALHREHPELRIFCAHDPDELEAARARLQKAAPASTLG